MQHGKNGGAQSSSGSGTLACWNVAFVTLIAMAAASFVIEAADPSNELANDATPGSIISSRPETAHPAGRVWHADHHLPLAGRADVGELQRARATIRFTDSS